MKLIVWATGTIALLSVIAGGQRQRDNWPKPPEPAVHEQAVSSQDAHVERRSVVEVEQDARELETLARTIPSDIEQMKRGLMPKDTLEKLKRIEKLAKKMRNEVGH